MTKKPEANDPKRPPGVAAPAPCSVLTRDEINFLLWCLGFAEGRAREMTSSTRSAYVLSNCDAVREKLMSGAPIIAPPRPIQECPACRGKGYLTSSKFPNGEQFECPVCHDAPNDKV